MTLPGPLAPSIVHLPHTQSAHFVGRDRVLDELHDSFTSADPSRHVQAVYGLSGVGKTHLAIQYAHQHRDRYRIIYWFAAEESASVWVACADLARGLGLVGPRDLSLEATRHLLLQHLADRNDFLLIFDNASGPAAIRQFIPTPCHGAVLVTSRNPNWSGLARSHALHGLAREDSVKFLRQRTGRLDSDSAAQKLAQALGDLPLALEQAAAVIVESRLSFTEYLNRYENHWAELLAAQRPGGDWPDSVAMTWELSLRQVESENPPAVELLTLLAFLAPDGISRRLIERSFAFLPEELSALATDAFRLSRALDDLARLSLIELHNTADGAGDAIVSLHRLVAALARNRLTEDRRRFYAGIAARLIADAFSFDSAAPDTWPDAAAMLPHALASATHAQATGVPVEVTCGLLDHAGRYLNRFGQYEQARNLLDRALAISRRAYGDDAPRVANLANNLGRVLSRLGLHEDALAYLEWALRIDQGAYGSSDPHVATVMNNYALALFAAGRADDARQYFESALAIFEACYGPTHLKVALLLNNLGYVHLCADDASSSIDFFHRALTSAQSALGHHHPTIASILHNLGTALVRTDRAQLALDHLQRALAIDTAAYGLNHPSIARDCAALAQAHLQLGDPTAAQTYQSQATAIRQTLATTTEDPDLLSSEDALTPTPT